MLSATVCTISGACSMPVAVQPGLPSSPGRPLLLPSRLPTPPPPALRTPPQVLRQKRMYEGQRDQLYQQQFNVEQTAFAMTSMQARRVGRRVACG